MNAPTPTNLPSRPARTALRLAPLAVVIAIALPCLAHADAVTDWNTTSYQTAAVGNAPPAQTRINAITHLAIHDALNSIEPRYRTYGGMQQARPGASSEAAVAAAAYETLRITVPSRAAQLLVTYNAYLADLACPAAFPGCIADGVEVGAAAAAAILALRDGDGSASPHVIPYVAAPAAPGVYQPTPGSPAPTFGNWGNLKPFVIKHGAQFRPWSPLLDLGSVTYAQEYAEVAAVGSAVVRGGANAGSDASLSTRFWAGGGANANLMTQKIAVGRGLDMLEHARLFALVNMAQADASIAIFNAKYHYNFWRPITAIHAAGDTGWTSWLSPAPPYPDYPSGLSGLAGGATQVLRMYFGTDALAFTITTAGGITRGFATLTASEADAAMSRVYGGIHFVSACVDGIDVGNKVGRYVFLHSLKPL